MKVKLFLTFTIFSLNALSAEYYLSTDGNDANLGSRSKPWASLQKAIWKLKSGDTLVIRGGKYVDASFADIATPSKGKVTTIRAEKNEVPVFDGRVSATQAVLSWEKKSEKIWLAKLNPKWKRIDGLWIKGQFVKRVKNLNELSTGMWLLDKQKNHALLHLKEAIDPTTIPIEFRLHSMIEFDTPFWRIEGITAQYYNYAGIVISSTHDVTIQNCKANYNGGAGVEADEASKIQILNNETSFNGSEGGPGWASGIHLWKIGSKDNVVKGNTSHHNWDPSDHHTDGNGIAIDKGVTGSGAVVSHNITFENGGRGIDININSNVKVHNNLIYNNGRDPLIREFGELCISESISTEGLEISRNTIRAQEKTPAVVIYKADPKSINSNANVICHHDNPNLAYSIYRVRSYSLSAWQSEMGLEKNSTADCNQEKHIE